jgi:hypothetical protein
MTPKKTLCPIQPYLNPRSFETICAWEEVWVANVSYRQLPGAGHFSLLRRPDQAAGQSVGYNPTGFFNL